MSANLALREHLVLDRLKETYEHQGFEFFVEPLAQMLPDFLSGFRPDAIALKPGENHVVEVKFGRRPGEERRLETLARLMAGHPDWQLRVFYEGQKPEDEISLGPPTQAQIDAQIAEAGQLAQQGHHTAALLLAWSVLEAIARGQSTGAIAARRPYSPAQSVQSLATTGVIDTETAKALRATAQMRNLAAHGALGTAIDPATVDDLLRLLHRLAGAAGAGDRSDIRLEN